jgi:hypothetical protein
MRTNDKIESQGTETKSITKWGTLLHFYVQERERNVAGALTGLRRVSGHFYGPRATAGGRPRGDASRYTAEYRLRPP